MFRRTSDRRRPSLMRGFGILTTLVLLIGLPVLAAGLWQGWFSLSSGSRAGQWQMEFMINTQEIKHDMGIATDERDQGAERQPINAPAPSEAK
jgi:hypothetical protein